MVITWMVVEAANGCEIIRTDGVADDLEFHNPLAS